MAAILLIDDDPNLLDVVSIALEDAGHQVQRAADGLEAWQWLQSNRPALVVSDVNMPRLDGFALQRLSDVLHHSSLKLEALLSELLELARAEAGLPNEERAPVPLVALLQGVAGSVAMDPRYPNVRFDVDAPPAELFVAGVSHRLEALLRNLLDNAASFAGEGGWVRARVEAGGVAVRVIVEDSGPGIVPEALPRVFDRFYTHRSDRRGTGLGLAMARAVAEAHGGSIRAESPPDQGARFTVELPLSMEAGRDAGRAVSS